MTETVHKSWGTAAVQLGLVVVVLVISVAGNGTVGALLIRFKKLRTIPNILVANIAVVDFLNTIINIPTFTLHIMLQVPGFLRPKSSAFVIGFLYAIFYQLNIYSMLLLALDRYGAIVHNMKYMLWKTRKKAYVAVGLAWIVALLSTVAAYIPFAAINIQNGTINDYRRAQFQNTGRIAVAVQAPLPVVAIGIVSVLTWRGMSRANKRVLNLEDMPARILQTREQTEVKAAKTMLMTFMVYVLSYVPSVTFTILVSNGLEVDETWHGFLASFGLFISSGCNPIIYVARNKRFRHAFKQFWKDPCGKSPFQEMKEERTAQKSPQQALPTAGAVQATSSHTQSQAPHGSSTSRAPHHTSIHTHKQTPPGSSKSRAAQPTSIHTQSQAPPGSSKSHAIQPTAILIHKQALPGSSKSRAAQPTSIHTHKQAPPGSSKNTLTVAFSVSQEEKKVQEASKTLKLETTKRHASLPRHLIATKTSQIE